MPHDSDRSAVAARLWRFRSALMLRGWSVTGAARATGVTGGHLRRVALGLRIPSRELVEALRGLLGDDALAHAGIAAERESVLQPRAVDADVAQVDNNTSRKASSDNQDS